MPALIIIGFISKLLNRRTTRMRADLEAQRERLKNMPVNVYDLEHRKSNKYTENGKETVATGTTG